MFQGQCLEDTGRVDTKPGLGVSNITASHPINPETPHHNSLQPMARNPRLYLEAAPNHNTAGPALASRHKAWNILRVVLAIAIQSHYCVRTAAQRFDKATPQCGPFATLSG